MDIPQTSHSCYSSLGNEHMVGAQQMVLNWNYRRGGKKSLDKKIRNWYANAIIGK